MKHLKVLDDEVNKAIEEGLAQSQEELAQIIQENAELDRKIAILDAILLASKH